MGKDTIHLPKSNTPAETVVEKKNDLVLVAPTPELNPRNQILKEIAERSNTEADENAKETVQAIDDDGREIEPVETVEPVETEPEVQEQEEQAPEFVAEQAPSFDADKEYDLIINGQPTKVKGSQIIERGKMALQKEIAADHKLELASRLLNEAKAMHQQPPAQGVAPVQTQGELSDEQLAEIIQFGTKEQAAQAISMLRRGGQTVEQTQAAMIRAMPNYIRDQLDFHEAAKFAQSEYGDLLSDPYLQQLFLLRENQLRKTGGPDGSGDKRSYRELYTEIGEGLRTHFNKPKSTPAASTPTPLTREEKVAAKAAAPAAPKLASARIESAAKEKPLSREEIIQKMQAARGQRAA